MLQSTYLLLLILVTSLVTLLGDKDFSSLMLSPSNMEAGRYWTLATYALLHINVFHLVCNVLVYISTASWLERKFGAKAFLTLTIATVLGSGIFWMLLQPEKNSAVIGASGLIMAYLTLWCLYHPTKLVFVLFFIPCKAMTALIGFGVLSALSIIFHWLPTISHTMHLLGVLAGLVFFLFYQKHYKDHRLFEKELEKQAEESEADEVEVGNFSSTPNPTEQEALVKIRIPNPKADLFEFTKFQATTQFLASYVWVFTTVTLIFEYLWLRFALKLHAANLDWINTKSPYALLSTFASVLLIGLLFTRYRAQGIALLILQTALRFFPLTTPAYMLVAIQALYMLIIASVAIYHVRSVLRERKLKEFCSKFIADPSTQIKTELTAFCKSLHPNAIVTFKKEPLREDEDTSANSTTTEVTK